MTSERKDINAVVTGLLRDMAAAQSSPQKSFGYRRAATAIFDLEQPLAALVDAAGSLQKIAGVGPATARVVVEVLEHGDSPTVERAIAQSGRALEIERRRALRDRFLSRSEVVRILADQKLSGRTPLPYKGDLQVHSEWSDGSPTIAQLAEAGLQRGYAHIGVTDHSHGLAIASGTTMAEVLQQHAEIDRVNHDYAGRFRIIKGIEANIGADGDLDLSDDEVDLFELVLAAPHSKLRRAEDQTDRMLRAVSVRGVHILAHPRGRISGIRAGIVANWNRVFDSAARADVAIEIDGDPSRQDLDYVLAAQALDAGCLFALDSDAHSTDQLQYTDTGYCPCATCRHPITAHHQLLAGAQACRVAGREEASQGHAADARRAPSFLEVTTAPAAVTLDRHVAGGRILMEFRRSPLSPLRPATCTGGDALAEGATRGGDLPARLVRAHT